MLVCLPQRWSLEALSSNSSWPSRTMARLCSNPWSKLLCFSAEKHFLCCMCKKKESALVPVVKVHSHLYRPTRGLCGVHSLEGKSNLFPIALKLRCRFSIKLQLPTRTDFPFAFHTPLILLTAPASFPHSSLCSYQIASISATTLIFDLRADIILLCQSQMSSRPFTSEGFQVTHRVLQWPCWRSRSLWQHDGCGISWVIHLINALCFDHVKPSSQLNVTVWFPAWEAADGSVLYLYMFLELWSFHVLTFADSGSVLIIVICHFSSRAGL